MTSSKTPYDAENLTRAQRAGGILAGEKLVGGGRVTAVDREYYPGGSDVIVTFEDGTARRMPASEDVGIDERFEAGDGASVRLWTDAHAYTVIRVSPSGKTITLQRAKATLDPEWKPEMILGGFAAHTANNHEQRWTYEPDPDGAVITARFTRRGWMRQGQRVSHGYREHYDYNF
jgi:hypothetical protein